MLSQSVRHARTLARWLILGLVFTGVPLKAGRSQARVDRDSALASEIGSLRNSRVAIPRGRPPTPLVYFAAAMGAELLSQLKETAPNLRVVVGLSPEEAVRRAAEAHGADAQYASAKFLEAAKNLVWVQSHSAGVERYLAVSELKTSERVVLTNMRGAHGPAIADHAFGMLLALTRDLPFYLDARARGQWAREGSKVLKPIALQGRTLLVIGLGGIGREMVRRGHGFGMRIIGIRRGDDPAPEFVERVGKATDLLPMLAEADVVMLAVPLTPETERIINRAALAAMKPGSFLVNIARGRLVDTDGLVEALKSGRLAGACLDVTDPEPLPPGHPLWRMPNVVITPHNSDLAELTVERENVVFLENLRRFDAGEPLLNVVDKKAGY